MDEKNLGTIPCHNSLIPWNIYFSFAIWNLWQDRNNILFKNTPSNSDLGRDVIVLPVNICFVILSL